MDCKECRDLMNGALDSQLGDKEVAFREHLEQCEECKREYEELVQMMRAIHDLPDFELPDGFRSRWQQAVREEDKGNLIVLPLWRKRGFQMAMGIAAAALIAVNIPNVFMMGSQDISMDEAPLEIAMEEPTMESAEYMKDGEQESRGDFGQLADEPMLQILPETAEFADAMTEEASEPVVASQESNGFMPRYYVDEADLVQVRAFFEEQEVYLIEVDEELEYPVLQVQLDIETFELWEDFLSGLKPDAEEDTTVAEKSQLVEIRVEIME
jgi:hypothetical protein